MKKFIASRSLFLLSGLLILFTISFWEYLWISSNVYYFSNISFFWPHILYVNIPELILLSVSIYYLFLVYSKSSINALIKISAKIQVVAIIIAFMFFPLAKLGSVYVHPHLGGPIGMLAVILGIFISIISVIILLAGFVMNFKITSPNNE